MFFFLFTPLTHAAVKKKARSAGSTKAETKPAEPQPEEIDISGLYYPKDKIEILWQGGWYKGEIMYREKPGFYKVHYDGYWHSRDEIVPVGNIRKPSKRVSVILTELKPGDAVELMDGDHYRPGAFVEAKDGKAVVKFKDGDKFKEEKVPPHKLTQVQ
ncbi:MAG: hypothetical protein U1F57_12260 [bacterium]